MLRVHAALFTVAFLFSVNYIVSKFGMMEFSPLAFAWLRILGSALAMTFIARNEAPLSRDDARRVAGYAILGVVLNQTLFLSGLAFTSVQSAAILITTIPVFTLAAAIVLGRERSNQRRIAGIALACIGALLVVGGEGATGTWRSLAGAAMIVANCLSYALYLVISKPAMARLSARAVVARMFGLGAILMFPICAYPLWKQNWNVSPRAWLALLIVIAGPSVTAYLLQAWALRHADSSVVAAYVYVQPVLATALGAMFLGEMLRPIVLGAAVLIFSGVWLAGSTKAATM